MGPAPIKALPDPPQGARESQLGGPARRRLAGFARTLRDNGFRVGLAETGDALAVLASHAGWEPTLLKPALRALFCATHSDWERFDEIFDAYWRGIGMRRRQTVSGVPQASHAGARKLAEAHVPQDALGLPDRVERRPERDGESPADGRGRREGASRTEVLSATDLRHIVDPQDVAAAHALAARLARTMRKIKPLRLVVLLDASGSMSLYTAFFVRFLHGVVDSFREAEAFVFHTRLAHVSPSLRDRDVTRAVEKLALMAQGIGGGTRIGESLATFNRWHARRVINSRTAVMIVSDGYDTGEAEHLSEEMRRLRRRCRKIIWLNPLIGWRDYSPQARGMQAALPYVDLFAPAHNLQSLAALEPYLARI
jgi:uncharacterized protein with von Willebrand factor type A (vWA) domain